MTKSVFVVLLIAIIIGGILVLNQKKISSIEVITDEGFYYRYMGMTCSGINESSFNFKFGLSPVRLNQYNACSDTNIEVILLGDNGLEKEFRFVWGQDDTCEINEEKVETVRIPMIEVLDEAGIKSICTTPKKFKVILKSFHIQHRERRQVDSDPLGQQPRIDSSVPSTRNTIHKDVNFDDTNLIIEIQQKLQIQGLYDGSIDGVWNEDLTAAIRNMLDSSHLFFITEKDMAVLEILDINHE